MNPAIEQSLISRIGSLSPQQVDEMADFVEFLAARQAKQAALNRLLAIAPALEAAGAQPMSMDEVNAKVKASRSERRARLASSASAS